MSSSDEDSTSYIRRYTINLEILNTFVTFLEDEERETESSARLYHTEYLRKPKQEDVDRVTAKHVEMHGFPHAYFGPAGSNNDINILDESDLFDQLLEDRVPVVNFTANGGQFTKRYYLAVGIYPEWSTLLNYFKCPMDPKTTKFKRYQEAARKDVERAFEVLQGRWEILSHGARPLSINKIKHTMYACVILHNMVVDYNGRVISPLELDLIPPERLVRTWDERVGTQLRMMGELRDRATHNRLHVALVEHIWNLPEHHRQC
uniref:uncharacterized protein LOC122601678 n=1 Tax=Erigeron canadensis TaxID=72917 RepID=UPI001CB914F1|nr:uncharacterized protein LOC122601678 [Erigeron canadensis]